MLENLMMNHKLPHSWHSKRCNVEPMLQPSFATNHPNLVLYVLTMTMPNVNNDPWHYLIDYFAALWHVYSGTIPEIKTTLTVTSSSNSINIKDPMTAAYLAHIN